MLQKYVTTESEKQEMDYEIKLIKWPVTTYKHHICAYYMLGTLLNLSLNEIHKIVVFLKFTFKWLIKN